MSSTTNNTNVQQPTQIPPTINTNLTPSGLVGTLNTKLSVLLISMFKFIQSSIMNTTPYLSSNNYITFKFRLVNLKPITLHLPFINLTNVSDPFVFNSNYREAFGKKFPDIVESSMFYGLNIKIYNDLPIDLKPNLGIHEFRSFRIIVCLFFGLMFNIKLGVDCSCFPCNVNEIAAVNAGLMMNCIKLECKNYLQINPMIYDSLFMGNCGDNVNYQVAFVSLSLFAGGNIEIKNINIKQTFDCLAPK